MGRRDSSGIRNLVLAVILIVLVTAGFSLWFLVLRPQTDGAVTTTHTASTTSFKSSTTSKTTMSTTATLAVNRTLAGHGVFSSAGMGELSIEAAAPQYVLPLDLSKIGNMMDVRDRLQLAPDGLDKLRQNGFVVLAGNWKDLAQFYKVSVESGLPIYVTTDSLLFIYHAFFDTILMELEENSLEPLLEEMIEAMVSDTLVLHQSFEEDTLARKASALDLAYLCVAAKLLDPSFQPPGIVSSLVEEEVSLINAADSPERSSPIFVYNEDYTQYKPRGHYTVSETLQRYFRAMMWLGRMRFEAQDPLNPGLARIQTAQALLLLHITQKTLLPDMGSAMRAWESIYLPTAFIVGRSDDLTLYDYGEAASRVFGQSFDPEQVNDEGKLSMFQQNVVEYDKSKIVNVPIFPVEKPRLVGLRFMGQRFILDGFIHQKLVYPDVKDRFMVKGLDVMASLGSTRAEELLEDEKRKYPGYDGNLQYLKSYVENLTVANWTQSLYMGWLYTLKAGLEPIPPGYPAFMKGVAWEDKSLNTALSSWAQLRHDTILYAKQPYAGKVSLPPEQPDVGYVEPMPAVYHRLQMLANSTLNGLKFLNLLSPSQEENLTKLLSLLQTLREISVKELRGQPLDEQERTALKGFGHTVEQLLGGLKERTKDPRLVADVFTDPNSNSVLQVATGYFDQIVVIYKTAAGELFAGVGATMSYYEFAWPQADRLTDEQWQSTLERGQAPMPLEWTASYRS